MESFPATYSEVTSPNDPVFNFLYVNAAGTGAPAIPAGMRNISAATSRRSTA